MSVVLRWTYPCQGGRSAACCNLTPTLLHATDSWRVGDVRTLCGRLLAHAHTMGRDTALYRTTPRCTCCTRRVAYHEVLTALGVYDVDEEGAHA